MSDSGRTPWPETTVFWGAGATAALGMPVTAAQGEALAILGRAGSRKDGKPVRERVADARVFDGIHTQVTDLLVALGEVVTSHPPEVSLEEKKAAARLFSSLDDQSRSRLVFSLRGQCDWDCLRQVIRICPATENRADFLRDLFNILDMHILAGKGFHVPPSGDSADEEVPFLTPSRLPAARNALAMLLGLMFHAAWRKCRIEKTHELAAYGGFCRILGQLMQEEGLRFAASPQMDRRPFYLFSYAVVSLNFDPILPWLLFNNHKDLNYASPPLVDTPAAEMTLFHDHGQVLALRPIDERRPDIWYPFTEAAAQRLNDPKYRSNRRVRLGKLYMPHGCLSWRDCPNCGRVTMCLGDEWRPDSETLLPPAVIAIPGANHEPRHSVEEKAREGGRYDAVQCSYCGEMTYMRDTPLILQSNFKRGHPSYLEEIQRDMRVCLENTQHVVLLGCSLPPDDVIYRVTLSARRARTQQPVYCSVVVGTSGEDRWLSRDQMSAYAEDRKHDPTSGAQTIQAAIDIFGEKHVRAYTAGIPKVFGTPPSRERILDLLYPVGVGIDCFTPNGVCRRPDA